MPRVLDDGLRLVLLVVAVTFAWWASRRTRLDGVRWRAIPLSRLRYLVAAQGLTGAATVFFIDLNHGAAGSRVSVLLLSAGAALVVATVFLVQTRVSRRAGRIVLLVIAAVVGGAVLPMVGHAGNQPVSLAGMKFDAAAIFVSMGLSTVAYGIHVATEGGRQLRAEAELALAHRLQGILVPPVQFRNTGFEIYGRTIPSEEVGGDLVDAFEADDAVVAYLVDVSGHGIPAGTLMGAVKAAIRSASSPLAATLETVNRVLPAVKEAAMYATLAAVRLAPTEHEVEYTLAGHHPILHYRAAAGTAEELTFPQFPLGFFPDARYETRRVPCAPGDVLALFSDGLVESANAADEHFGVHRLAGVLAASGERPLEDVFKAVFAAASSHGSSDDDRSLLLVRVL